MNRGSGNRYPEIKDPVPSDLEIAQEATLKPISEVRRASGSCQ